MNPDFNIQLTDSTAQSATFVIEPLPQGFGNTLGNSLRRVLYTSIKGAAITSVNITGTNHQFTTLPGVREDIVQLVLALKQVRLSYTGEGPTKITLSVSGPREVTAADFETPANVTVANPELVLAHLADKGTKLELEAVVESGYGYSPADERRGSTVGVIPTDATFSPITRVNYSVEATRVGRVTNFDKLILDITTDGTVAPASALAQASQTLVNYFALIANPQSAAAGSAMSSAHSATTGVSVTVEELDLPTRITNALQKSGFDTVSSLLSVPKSELAKVKNLGAKSVKIIEAALKERGIELVS